MDRYMLSMGVAMVLSVFVVGCDTKSPTPEAEGDATDTGEDTDAGDTDADDTDAEDTDAEDTAAGDTDTDDTASDTDGSGDTGADTAGETGGNDVTGTYGADPVAPVQAAYWIGAPGNPDEANGGPFLYLFSAPVTCEDLSQSSWLDTIPAGTQVLEMIVGSTTAGAVLPVSGHAGADVVEVNYAIAGGGSETRATDGSVTLATYADGVAVSGTLDLTFPDGGATGSFEATWCPTGQEF